jgi:predicted nucleic acid-binding protein
VTPRLAYIDTSALAKLTNHEPETSALEHDLAERDGLLCSRLAATELRRASARVNRVRLLQQVDDVLESVYLVEVTPAILEAAARLAPPLLRTLDAIHLATLASFGERVDLITYDNRLGDAAARLGFRVVSPGTR